jgi:cobalt transporter subunit CbtA
MIGRIVLAALLAGLCAGIIMAGIQHLRLTPLILQAEVFEAGHHHGAGAEATHQQESDGWRPADGLARTLSTSLTLLLAGAGFALILAAVSLISGIAISRANCLIWGLCGFLAVNLAPAAGLPPELPGMPAGDLMLRQFWWMATVAATAGGLYLIATRTGTLAVLAAIALISLPHLIGAPQPVTHETSVPAGLAAAFASNTLAANAVFWSLIAAFLSYALQVVQRSEATA